LTVYRRPLAKHWGLLSPRAAWEHLCVAMRIRRLISRRDGVVHCARLLPEGLSALMARLLGGPRYVCWAHGEDLVIAQSSRELVFFLTLVLKHAEAVLANSHNTAALLATLGVPAARIHVVHPAVDAERFHPGVSGQEIRRRHAAPDDVLLLSVGRLQRRKGHDVAIRAVAALRHELPHLRYLIAGDGEERARLEQIACEHGVQDRVSFAGVVPDGDLPAYYAACDVFLLPNRIDNGDIEGFGIVFLEAAATGKPVIGGDSGGVPEAVERDITGLLVAIRELATSAPRRRQMGAAGRARAQRQFSWQRAATLVTALQGRLAGARGTNART
jgi:phosphatidylinositol alpha-1,6-mannosyltransferase